MWAGRILVVRFRIFMNVVPLVSPTPRPRGQVTRLNATNKFQRVLLSFIVRGQLGFARARGSMNHVCRPFVPDSHERAHLRAQHPLGERANVHAPWDDGPTQHEMATQQYHRRRGIRMAGEQQPRAPTPSPASSAQLAGRAVQPLPPRQPTPHPAPSSLPPAAQHHPHPPRGPPSHQDVYALWRLAGGEESQVADMLARLYQAPVEQVAPGVRDWVRDNRPSLIPVSRSQSEPPARSTPWVESLGTLHRRLTSSGMLEGAPPSRRPDPLPHSAPPWPGAPRGRSSPHSGTRVLRLEPTAEEQDSLSTFMGGR